MRVFAQNLCKSYPLPGTLTGRKTVLDNVSFSFSEGERVGIIGRNGAGKTTLLQIISGIAAPSSGKIVVDGRVTAIFTLGVGLRDELTGRENIVIDGELHGRSKSETLELLPQVIAFADIGEFIDRPVRTYSTGMKARLAFAMLVHIDPEVLIVDEALSVGDIVFSSKARAKMQELAQRGRIVLLVSHSMDAIRSMCTRCVWVDNGKIRMDGSPDEVTRAYTDHVRQVDEAVAREDFRRKKGRGSLQESIAIRSLELHSGHSDASSSAILETGVPACIRATVEAPPGAELYGRVQLTRLDGTHICTSDSAKDLGAVLTGQSPSVNLKIDLGRLPLNQGLYAIRMDVSCDGKPAAWATQTFEVVNPAPLKGGRPILVVPYSMNSIKVA